MRASRFFSLAIWVCLFFLFWRTAVAADFGEFTIRDELDLAQKFDLVLESRFPGVEDTRITAYVEGLVARLVRVMPAQPFPVSVRVVRNEKMNAFASAAGHVTLFTGLLTNLDSEDELASVLAHELAHVSERHIAESIRQSRIMSIGSLLGVLAGAFIGAQGKNSDAGSTMVLGSLAGAQAAQLGYSRAHEREADQFGMDFLLKAGFGPRGMLQAFEKLRRMENFTGGGAVPGYLKTHPGMTERLEYIGQRVESLSPAIRKRVSKNTAFLRARLLTEAWYTPPQAALAVFSASTRYPEGLALLGRAIALSRLDRIEDARRFFQQGMHVYGRDGLWKREYGRFSFHYGDLHLAEQLFQDVLQESSEDLLAIFFLARCRAEQGKHVEALQGMSAILRVLPRDAEVLEYAGRYAGSLGRLVEAHVYLARSAAYAGNFRKAEFFFQKAERSASNKKDKDFVQGARQEIESYQELFAQIS